MGQNRKTRQRKKVSRSKRVYHQSVSPWHVYMIECLNGALYTGITNDLAKRFVAHQIGKGAKYTKVFGVRRMVYNEEVGPRVEAMKREREIKRWPRKKKLALINK